MIGSSLRYALRSLGRNARRTLLSVVGLAFGVGIGLIALSFVGGMDRMSLDAVARGGIGHLRIAPQGWVIRRDEAMRLHDDPDLLARVRAVDGVALAAPRARVGGLLGLGNRSAHVTLTGVDPAIEPSMCRYVSEIEEGRYLTPEDRGAVVLGGAIIDRLDARLGDELVVSVVDGEGEMRSALLTVVGIVRTGSRAIDLSVAQVTLSDVEEVSGRAGLSEISILLDDPSRLEVARAAIDAEIPSSEERDEVLSWLDISDGLRMKIESGASFTRVAIFIILLVVLLGVASAQLTAVLERRKEFAVLSAIGMPSWALVRVVLTEGFILGALGGLLAIVWTTPILYRWSTAGIDIGAMIPRNEEGIAFSGVLIDPFYYPTFGLWVLPTALSLSVVATLLASLYPAWFASRTDPAAALRVDR
jgi:ABC-type lipoprotein release transport system permease subunit